MKVRDVIKPLVVDGWYLDRYVVVAVSLNTHQKIGLSLCLISQVMGAFNSILKQAELK
jgi:hypothetical protein